MTQGPQWIVSHRYFWWYNISTTICQESNMSSIPSWKSLTIASLKFLAFLPLLAVLQSVSSRWWPFKSSSLNRGKCHWRCCHSSSVKLPCLLLWIVGSSVRLGGGYSQGIPLPIPWTTSHHVKLSNGKSACIILTSLSQQKPSK